MKTIRTVDDLIEALEPYRGATIKMIDENCEPSDITAFDYDEDYNTVTLYNY